MPRSFIIVVILSAFMALALSGCATTGDPTAGGLFGWSETKARERQAVARAELGREERRGEELRAERARLQRQINAKKSQVSAIRKKSAKSPGGPSQAEKAQITRLEREIDEMTREAMAMMDM